MTTKAEFITQLKAEYPTLKTGDEEAGYKDLSKADYEAQIALWADNKLAKESEDAQVAAEATAKTALLAKLGITADEAELLLS